MSIPMTDDQLKALGAWAVEVPAVPLWVEADIVNLIAEVRRLRTERAGGWAKRAVVEQKRADTAELQRDTATEVVENIQGKVAMYAGKFETLAVKVQSMRTSQKDYFRTRHQEALTLSKKLEREVDDLVKEIAAGEPLQEQGRLV